ncbi:MAG: hypothetical protein JNL90_20600 [Planctomycetes bacterium]|nr:hypothetical protein [Planctomycetota bacterium]
MGTKQRLSSHELRRRRSRRANALLLALGATTTLIVAGGTLLVSVAEERTATEQSIVAAQARDASTSGAEDALARLAADPNTEGSWQVDLGGPIADVTVVDWGDNGADDDDDGAIDEADEQDYLSVLSIGRANELLDGNGLLIERRTRHASSATEVILQRTELDLAANQAVYVDDANASFKFSGTAFLINGNDTNLDGSAGPNAALPGIGTVGDPTGISSQLKSNQKDKVIGLGGNPSVATVSDIDLSATMDALRQIATVEFAGPDDSFSGELGDLSNEVPVVTYAKGNLKLNGNTSGCGVLIVDGDIDFNGTFDYAGLVYVSGAVRFNGGGGGKNVRGALFTLGAVTGNDVTINGSVALAYSSEAIALVNTQLSSGVQVVSWRRR